MKITNRNQFQNLRESRETYCTFCSETEAPSTRIWIFLKTHLVLSVLGLRPHGDGVFGHQKRSFSKTLSRVDLFENTVFLLSCGRVKTELFENADVTASI